MEKRDAVLLDFGEIGTLFEKPRLPERQHLKPPKSRDSLKPSLCLIVQLVAKDVSGNIQTSKYGIISV
jgi:hypothetical protein